MKQEVEIFLSYAREDRIWAENLLERLSVLHWPQTVDIWSAEDIIAGQEWEQAIREHLRRAQIILLLVSPAFLASRDSRYEMSLIEEKQRAGKALVIPIILRPTDWSRTSFANLEPLPAEGKPLSTWTSPDLAYREIVDKIFKKTIETLNSPAKVNEEDQLRKDLETFSEQELLALGFDLRLNIKVLFEYTPERSEGELPKISVDRLIRYMKEQDRLKELADYVRRNRPAS